MMLKKKVVKIMTDLSIKVALAAAGQVSTAGTHQPKEPECLKCLKSKQFKS